MATAAPPVEGASVVSEVDPGLAAAAQAEVAAARAAPRVETPPASGPAKRKRGRPPGSGAKPKAVTTGGTVVGPSAGTTTEEGEELATPEDFLSFVDLANMAFEQSMVAPIGADDARKWAGQAAKVANRWGGQIPLLPEIALIGSTAMIFGPRVVTMFDPVHKAKIAAVKRKAEEEEHKRKLDEDARRQ